MDAKQFSDKSPGEIVSISGQGASCAFVPDPLPPTWEFPTSLWPILAEAKEKVALLEGIGRTLPDPGLLLAPLQDAEALSSSRIEGTYATAKELLLFEMDETEETRSTDARRGDWKEVLNYRKALKLGDETEWPLSSALIRELHKVLLTGARSRVTPGAFRKIQVAIGTGRRFVPPPPERLNDCMEPFVRFLDHRKKYDPLVDCFLAHYQFETIHPFEDGNGRVGRLLLAMTLRQWCSLTKPWLYLSEFFEMHRDEYFDRLFRVSVVGAWTEWIEFCLKGTITQAERTIERCDQLRILREEWYQKIASIGGNNRLLKIVDHLFHAPVVRVAALPKLLGVTYPTAKSDVSLLVNAGVLELLVEKPQKTYYAPRIFKIAFGGID